MATVTQDRLTADQFLRKQVSVSPLPPDMPAAFTPPPPLNKARVAIVTTIGLMRHGETAWDHDEADFRVFDADERDLIVGHVSMSFDRSGVTADRNVAYPIDRLKEMAAAGKIGSVAPRHISFMGAMRFSEQMSTIILDSGPRAARLLKEDGVDVVVLTPACPACGKTVLVLARVLEAEGLSTVVLASNINFAERAEAPRALYCEFPLGRPLGKPNDPDFQNRVLSEAFELFYRKDGPVLKTFPEEIHDEADTPIACALPPHYDPALPPAVDEARGLHAAYERAREKNGHTNVGLRLTAEEVPDAIPAYIAVARGQPWREGFSSEHELTEKAKDIRNYYEEAAVELAGHVPAARSTEAWFYRKTKTGKVFLDAFHELRNSGQEKGMSIMALYYLVPAAQENAENGMSYD
jgi:D-proline reductase (dithiol) PrdB